MKRNKFQILLMITLVLSFFCAGCDLPIEFGYSNVTDDLGDPVIKDDSSANDESNKDNEFLISNVSYIKLVGENTLDSTSTHGLEIVY